MAPQNDMKMAEETYGGFLFFLKWGTIVTVLIAILVVLLIA